MCAAPVGANADKKRGCRLSEEIKRIGSSSDSPAARSRFLGVEDSKYRRYEAGANIPNDLLAVIAEKGGDVVYILTGIRSKPSPAPAGRTAGAPRAPQCIPISSSQSQPAEHDRCVLEYVRTILEYEALVRSRNDALLSEEWHKRVSDDTAEFRLGLDEAYEVMRRVAAGIPVDDIDSVRADGSDLKDTQAG